MGDTKAGAPFRSYITNAKLFVPAGTLDQAKGGDTFWPMQFGLALSAPAYFVANLPLSEKQADDFSNT